MFILENVCKLMLKIITIQRYKIKNNRGFFYYKAYTPSMLVNVYGTELNNLCIRRRIL